MPKTLRELERISKGEADFTANERIKTGGWLRVVYDPALRCFAYYRDKGRGNYKLTRTEAEMLNAAQ